MLTTTSPLEYLVVFGIIFAAGALSSSCLGKYVEKVRRETPRHA